MGFGEVVEVVASRKQQRIALALSLASLVLVAALVPFAAVPLVQLPHISGMYGAAVAGTNLATFWLLISSPSQTRAHSAIAAAYLFSGLMAIAHVLVFPGAVLDKDPVLGSPHAASWLFVTWRAGFAAFIAWAAFCERPASAHEGSLPRGSSRLPVLAAVGTAVVALIASQLTDAAAMSVQGNREFFQAFTTYGSYAAAAVAFAAVFLIFQRGLFRRSIFVWLIFVMTAEAAGVWVSTYGGARYTVAWYTIRVEGVVASIVLLLLMAQHFRRLQKRLADAVKVLEGRTEHLQAEMHRRERAEAELARAEKLKAVGQIGATLAHDLNNILQVITGRLSILQRRVGPVGDGDAEVIRRNVRKAEALTRQLTVLSGRRQFTAQTLDIAPTIATVADTVRLLLASTHTLRLQVDSDLPSVALDVLEFEVALTNLVTNARDAMPSGGEIVIHAARVDRALGRGLAISVTDHGTGIRPEIRPHIFEPFFSTKESGKGTGLGLAQVHAFVTSCGGMVEVESTAGVGSVIRLILPLRTIERAAPDAEMHDVAAAPVQPGQVILLVEDNDDVREASEQLLEAGGFVVQSARSSVDALDLLAQGLRPDVVISDIVMPHGIHGVELVRQIRRQLPGVRSVLVTGHSEVAAGARREGLPVIAKPYSLEALLQALR
ncbi:ATP-binding protein [Mitsuaria sp. 7]|uniref:ATP-binding protein n=1 Tax=Mitsuaria sp. 7 TaxID=1658665 RepID=UPI0007DE16F9|nr:ATP-binding protein [Mitsuaria sp. 7]ANH66637.1 hypothetical protein ABE85_01980 [Mitsuaria sp. 7]